jgi:hypothetical protein
MTATGLRLLVVVPSTHGSTDEIAGAVCPRVPAGQG